MKTARGKESLNSGKRNAKTALLLPLIIIAVISFGVYFNTLQNGFVDDDGAQVLRNPWIQDVRYLPDIFSKSVWSFLKNSVSNYYRPMMHVVYMINYHIFGLNPWGFHLVNVLFHVGNTVLVFFIAERLLGASHVMRDNGGFVIPACPGSFLERDSRPGGSPEVTGQARMTKGQAGLPTAISSSLFTSHYSRSFAFIAALLFATHPINTEAVAWIAALPELSFTFFCLLSFYFFMGYAGDLTNGSVRPPREADRGPLLKKDSGQAGMTKGQAGMTERGKRYRNYLRYAGTTNKGAVFYALSVLSFFLALFFKETALTFPLVLVACDLAFKGKGQRPGVYAKRYLPYLVVAVVYFLMRYRVLSGVLAPIKEYEGLTAYQLVINILPLFSEYLEKLLLPINLNFWHSFYPILSLFTVKGTISLTVALLFLCSMVISWKKNRIAFLALVIILVPLLPAFYLKVLPGKPFAERYLYLPSVGFAILSALLLLWLQGKFRKSIVIFLVFISLAAFYSAGTITRNTIWKDNYLLFSDTVAKAPDAAIPRYNLAVALMNDKGLVDDAIGQFEVLTKAHPYNSRDHTAFGHALLLKNRLDEAIEQLNTAISLDPNTRETYLDLGVALRQKGLIRESIAHYEKAIRIDQDYAEAHFNLANAYADSGRTDEAIGHYREAVRLRPDNAFYHNMLGIAYGRKGMYAEAVGQFREAVRLAPSESAYRKNLERAEGLKNSAGKAEHFPGTQKEK